MWSLTASFDPHRAVVRQTYIHITLNHSGSSLNPGPNSAGSYIGSQICIYASFKSGTNDVGICKWRNSGDGTITSSDCENRVDRTVSRCRATTGIGQQSAIGPKSSNMYLLRSNLL